MGYKRRHERCRRLVAAEPSARCLICDKPLAQKQERFCCSSHKNEWHTMARDIGEFVMEMMREVFKRHRGEP